MRPYGSAVIECRQEAFTVSAGNEIFASFFPSEDPLEDLYQARSCAASLAETVFFSSSVERYWTAAARPGATA